MAKNNVDVLLWRINRILYKDGNYIDYIYETVNNEIRIKEIKYTGNASVVPALLPYNSIVFEYKNRDGNQKFKTTTYEFDKEISLNSLISKITINADGQRFKSYTFNYANNNVNVFLNEVIETGADDILALNSTIFKYGDQPTEVLSTSIGFSNPNGNDFISGDFNGDGYTDLALANKIVLDNRLFHTSMSVYTKIPSDLGNGFTYKYNITFPYNGTINLGGSNFNILSSDFNGDGRDDIAIPMTSGTLHPFNFEYLKIYYNNFGAASATQVDIYLPAGAYQSINLDKKFFVSGDFNGDGVRDVIVITTVGFGLNTSKAYIWYGNSGTTVFSEISINGSSQFLINNWETKILNSLDFDGDGKDEIMITKGSLSEIFSLDINVAKSIKIAGFPTEWHLMYFGDFNGDRKTDILLRAGLNNNSAPWNVATNTGKEWIEKPFTWFNVLPDVNENYQGDKVLVSDFNGDGKADVIHHFNWTTGSKINTYYSLGNEFSYFPSSNTAAQSSIYVLGDFNSDGRSDFINRPNSTSLSSIIYMNAIGQELLLQRIKNGEGHVTQFNYNRMSEGGSHYTKGVSTYPFFSLSLPMYLVTRIDKDGLAETTYNYHDGILHRKGKGFLGFRRVTENGPINALYRSGNGSRAYSGSTRYDHKQHNYYNLNSTHALLLLDSIINVKSTERINKKTITNVIVQQNTGTLQKILWFKMPIVCDENLLENTKTESNNLTYDTDGNVTNSNLIQYSKSGVIFTEVERKVTVSEYGIFGSFRKNVPTIITNTSSRPGQSDYTSIVKYTYNSLGQLLTQIDFFGQPKALTHTYAYNTLGNLSGLTLNSTGLTSRSTTNIYDSKGRYIELSTNAAGQTSNATYDPRWAKPLTSIGVDGIKSKFEYDVFGRLKKTYYRKDLTDEFFATVDYNWATFPASYHILISHPGKPDIKTYYDNLNRKISVETEGFQGYWIKEAYNYDANGNIVLHTGPHRPLLSESGLLTTSVFDEYGRLKAVTNSLKTIEYTYSYTDGKIKITQTLDLPVGQTDQLSSQTKDVTGKVISTTDDSGTLDFTYYSHGKIRNVKRGTTTYSTMVYDSYARQNILIDINSGTSTYEYNAFGELIKENQPSNSNLTFTYNNLGNITSKSGTEGTTSFLYYMSGVKINKLEKITSFTSGYEESFVYDNVYGKLTSKTEKINNTNFVTSFTYNKYDDLLSTTYPSSVLVSNEYDANGFLTMVKNGAVTLFTNQGMTPYNNYKTYQYGNGLITDVTYNQTFPTRYYARNNTATTKRQDLNLVWNYGTGNLTSRNDVLVNKTETFGYDIMNRLTTTKVGTDPTISMNYSSDGNMTIKSDAAGANGLEYLNPKINAISKIQNPLITNLFITQNITYSVYQRPTNISENLKSIDLNYSYDYERRMAIFKTNNITNETRWYDGNYEKQISGSTTREIHYVSNGERLIAIIVKEGSTISNYYVHSDHLGSILAVTNSSMFYEGQQNYDAWGRKRNVTSWAYTSVNSVPTWLYRGYTGHEEYDQFNLINMNARLYDSQIGRMLSPDIAVTMPYSTQGYNRYSYANNNPLKYTDPDGNEIISAIIIGAAIGVAMNGISNVIQEKNFFDGWGKAAIIGAITGGISDGIGWVAGNIVGATKVEVSLAQGLLHGWSGALFTTLQGGNPGSGFVSGLSSSLTASSVQSLGGGKIGTFIGGGLSGGVGAAVVGGNFYQGLTFGLISSSLNHAVHEFAQVLKPLFSYLEKNYPKYGPMYENGGFSDLDFAQMAGGKVQFNIEGGTFRNTCALRVCFALTISGVDLPLVTGYGNSSSMDGGKWLYPKVAVLTKVLNKLYGRGLPINSINQLSGKQGIIVFHTPGRYVDATGHASLWNGSQVLGGNNNYLPDLGTSVTASFWPFK